MIIFTTFAYALDCTGLDAQVCQDANDLAGMVAASWGSPVVNDTTGKARLRTQTLYDNLLAMRAAIEPDCTVDGLMGGRYQNGATFSGTWVTSSPAGSGTHLGDVPFGGSFQGTQSGTTTAVLGDHYGLFQGGQFVGNRDADDFVGGHFAKVSGIQGIYYGYTGSCSINTPRALDPWFVGSLLPFHTLRIFNSRPWMNPMTGVEAMDAKCQADWDELGDSPGVYLAAVTDTPAGILSPAQRFPADQELVLVGTEDLVAPDVATFFDLLTNASQPIDVEADGSTFPWVRNSQESLTWWGDYPSDHPYSLGGNDCDGWTNPTASQTLLGGEPNTNYVRVYGWSLRCDFLPGRMSRTYCIEGS